ncbi:unnamed protein product [Camellia sinensis]
MTDIPNEIIVNILSRLSVTTLCRFKCVSKPWLALISDPFFIKTQLNRNTDDNHHHDRLILLSSSSNFHSINFKSFQFQNNFEAFHLKFPSKQNPNLCKEIWGSCNGLLLMLNDYFSFFLVNPSTRQSKKLPISPFSMNSVDKCLCLDSYGLGYDSSSDDHKVVSIAHYGYGCDFDDNIVSVYSLRTSSWRRIEDSPYIHTPYGPSSGIFVNGALHWFASSFVGSNNSTVIASLDLTYENFGDVPSPVDDFVLFGELSVLGGCLCMIVSRRGGCKDVWVMKEYGVRDSWTKFTINHGCFPLCKALCLSKTGEFLLGICQKKLIFYNPQEKKFKRLVVRACPNNFVAGTYVESLVSPNCSNMITRQ